MTHSLYVQKAVDLIYAIDFHYRKKAVDVKPLVPLATGAWIL